MFITTLDSLLPFFNRTLASPLLDVLISIWTLVGLALLPTLAIGLILRRERLGWALLSVGVSALLLTFLFQYLGLRPRPETTRLVGAMPNFPAFPSGHAAGAFAFAVLLGLKARRGWVWLGVLTYAIALSLSRLYLGVHYPTDVLGGALLGAGVGAAHYGLWFETGRARWRWCLWLQVALVLFITLMANLNLVAGQWLLRLPGMDKVLHFLLFGSLAFWLTWWWQGRVPRAALWAILLPLALATLDELAQSRTPWRSADLGDWLADASGMVLFAWAAHYWLTRPFSSAQRPLPSP